MRIQPYGQDCQTDESASEAFRNETGDSLACVNLPGH